jgi:hypothetical protein|tara:strand:- start:171 stop:395 length:225 start_codon:yes stop_codon:yes gene_type:complete
MPYKDKDNQVNIQAVCRHLDVGRYDLIRIATKVARLEKIRPHDALKKLLEIEDLDVYFKEMKERQIKAEFNSRF